jgi:hypothetical protein
MSGLAWIFQRIVKQAVQAAILLAVFAIAVPSCGTAGQDAERAEDPAQAGPGATSGAAAESPPNSLSDTERADGWKLLFNGETFAGWRGLGREEVPTAHWVIEDGNIRKVASGDVPTAPDGQPLGGGDIMTVNTYEDFELVLEWRVAPGANSGIKYNVDEGMSTLLPPSFAALGFEYQILDDDLHPDAQNGPNRTAAALYDMIAPDAGKNLRPVGEYNEARVVFRGEHGEHWLNGVKVVEYDLGTERFANLLAASKYQPITGFADRRKGHIVLQDHGDNVWFRNIKIRELPPR